MSAIDDLIAQVQEPRLREQLRREWGEAQKTRKFGLVFDRHLPELVPIPKARPRRDDLVARKGGSLTDLWRVRRVSGGMAHCVRPEGTPGAGDPWDWPLDELVVVRQFGEPIFPAPFQFLGRMEVAQVNLPLGTLELDALRQMANPARVQPSSAEQDTDCPLPGGDACRRGHVSARCWCQCRQASTSRVAASSGSTKMPITAL